ncbi:MAG TPA: TraB/GumN family protein, partial [Vicinamibacterales bacterium]|nr:TraB/GumN family protein [Vicinamibacterales bacterium]
KSGDMPAMERIVLPDMTNDPVMYQRLLVARNSNWLPKIEALFLRPRPSLVVVGAAHLIGPDGLLQSLKTRGYTIEQQ